ncbi:GTP 3',8-cyclase MoaA [Streptosporangium sp. NPDC051022]|uniref:GTP 3',8-cyclase MoaA n=1 Tax=Streptosporangium sp. NPDC051022 TaxID=3155752 RepID=UPI003424BF5E
MTPVGPPGTSAAGPPYGGALVDRYGRVATDLRVSVTDRCNLRCTYCMPAEGLAWLPKDEVLTDDEIVRLVRVGVELLGIREVRFTGGEPLVRPGLTALVAGVAALTPRPGIAVTTNGLTLARRVGALAAAGLDRVNVSLDTLRPDRFRALTRRDRLADVLDGLEAAAASGLTRVKVNAVPMRGVNDDEACDLLSYCLERGYELRFIEQMPLDADRRWSRADMVTAEEVLASLRSRFTLTPLPGRGASPAEHFLVDGGPARVGVIASVTRPFCGDCDRTRLTADGQIRSCLFSRTEDDLRALLRGGARDEDIAAAWRGTMAAKPAGHGVNDPSFVQPSRTMSAIGG